MKKEKKAICPILSGTKLNEKIGGPEEIFQHRECLEDQCALWLPCVYSTEGISQCGRCSLKFLGEKNSEGLLPV